MKKSLVVLLIAVLALSAVFAADVAITVEGDVSASYVFDFDDMTGTYNVPELNGALAWELVLPVAKAGSEYPYIDVAGEIDVDLADVAYYLTPEVDFSTFAIVGEDWKVNFLASIGTLDYAVSAIDTTWYAPRNKYGMQTGRYVPAALTYMWQSAAYYNDAVAISKDGVGTLTFVGANTEESSKVSTEVVTVFRNYNDAENYVGRMNSNPYKSEYVSYQINPVKDSVRNLWIVEKVTTYVPETVVFAVEAESAELKLADSITTQFGFGFAKKDVKADSNTETMNAGFSTKSSYEDILTIAADFGYIFKGAADGEKPFSVDVASSFKYEMVSVDVYYAYGILWFNNAKDLYRTTQLYKPYNDITGFKNLLSAKAAVEVEEIGTVFTFTGKDLLNYDDGISLAYKAVNTYFDNYTFTFGAEAVDDDHIVVDSVSFLAEADYAEEVGVTSYAGITAYRDTRAEAEKSFYFFPVFEVGFAYAKNGFSFSVDFSSLKEIVGGTRADYAKLAKTFENTAFTVKAGYEAEMFTVSGAVEYNTHEQSAKSYRPWALLSGLYVSTGIESDKLIDGATLSLDYASGELLTSHKYGSVTAAVTVEF